MVIGMAVLLIARLFYLQIINDEFKLKSDNNAIKIKYEVMNDYTKKYKRKTFWS